MTRSSRILVVDDEPRNIRAMERILRPQGYEVITARDGYECLNRIGEATPDLILLDVMMPGIDGFETTRRIRSHESTCMTPVVIISGLQGAENRITGIEAGCDDFISKPFDEREVLARVQASLSLRQDWERRRNSDNQEGQRMQQELEIARQAQALLLPKTFPFIAGLDIWGESVNSLEVSGDYFDVIDLGEDEPVIFAIADVSGKGLPAALIMSSIQACLRTQLLYGICDLSALMRNLNNLVYRNTSCDRFVTMFVGEYWKRDHRLRYVSAGHEAPYIVRKASIIPLPADGTVLGLAPNEDFQVTEARLEVGDLCCFYTDGVSDAMNADGESFGNERLSALLAGAGDQSAEQVGRAILSSVTGFTAGTDQFDDITLMLVRVGAGQLHS